MFFPRTAPAFSLTMSDISAGNSLSVPQYIAVPLFYTD